MTNEANTPHGPICIGLDAGCPDCKRLQRYQSAGHYPYEAVDHAPDASELNERIATLESQAGELAQSCRQLRSRVDRLESKARGIRINAQYDYAAELERDPTNPRPNPRDLPGHPSPELAALWRSEADRWIRTDDRDRLQMACTRLLDALAELERLGAEGERQRELLRRVRCYAVVDPLGNPAAVCLPNAARMLGIERDIDDALKTPLYCEPKPKP